MAMHKIFEFIRFCAVGFFALIIQYGLYYVGLEFVGHNYAYLISYILSAAFNFVLTIQFTFKVDYSRAKLIGFLVCHLINLLLQLILLNIFIIVGLSKQLAPIPIYMIAVPTNFILVRYVMRTF